MDPERSVALAQTTDHLHIVALLETDSIARVPMNLAARNDRAGTAVEEDATPATAIQGDVFIFVAVISDGRNNT